MPRVYVFKSSDSGAPTMSGSVGALVGVLDATLIVNKVYFTADDAAFTDNTTEAVLDGGTAFNLLSNPASGTDRCYVGLQRPFDKMKFDLATMGVGGTYVVEYWNGSAWTALTVTDGTSGFTADGTITWTIPTDWTTKAVNSVTLYWVRIRASANPSTTPTVNSVTVTGWLKKYSGTNKAAYQQGGGNSFFLRVRDDAPSTGKEAYMVGYETMSDVDTGTGLFPTAVQDAQGVVCRKSNAADATARAWVVVCDDRTVYIFTYDSLSALPNTTPVQVQGFMFGDIYSFVSSDGYRTAIIGNMDENRANNGNESLPVANAISNNVAAHYIARAYTGAGSSIQFGKHGHSAVLSANRISSGSMQWPNAPDGGIWVGPVWCHEGANVRGRLRGLCWFGHAAANVMDNEVFSGAGAYAGKQFLLLRIAIQGFTEGVYCMDITESGWETN
jgi:hypothetical protein